MKIFNIQHSRALWWIQCIVIFLVYSIGSWTPSHGQTHVEILTTTADHVVTIRDFMYHDRFDVFSFVDLGNPFAGRSTAYLEVNPRLKIYRCLYAAYMVESSPVSRSQMWGATLDIWRIQIHLYQRLDGYMQVTLVWFVNWHGFEIHGFHDSGRFGTVSQPQIRYVITPGISAGIEAQYFTIGENDHRMQFMLRVKI